MTDHQESSDSGREIRALERDRSRLAEEVVTLQQQLKQSITAGAAAEQQAAAARAAEAGAAAAVLAAEKGAAAAAEAAKQHLVEAVQTAATEAEEEAASRIKEQMTMESLMANAIAAGVIPKFNGDPSSGMQFDNFLTDYEIACDGFGLQEDEKKAMFLSTRLHGHALDVYKKKVAQDGNLKKDYANLTAALREYFKVLTDSRRVGTSTFYARSQLPGESVVSYFDELTKLAKCAYPVDTPMPDSQFLDRFIRGMNHYLRSAVVGKSPKTSQSALETACQAEGNKMYLDQDRAVTIAAASVDVKAQLEKKMDTLTSQVNSLSTQIGENPYTNQQGRSPTNEERDDWPRPRHHFPRELPMPAMAFQQTWPRQQNWRGMQQRNPQMWRQRRFQTQTPTPPIREWRAPNQWRADGQQSVQRRLPNYNAEGQPRCFKCNLYGHMKASCGVRSVTKNGYNGAKPRTRVNQVAVGETGVELTDDTDNNENANMDQKDPQKSCPMTEQKNTGISGSLTPGHSYLYIAMIAACMIPGAWSQQALICDTRLPGQIFKLPNSLQCGLTTAAETELPTEVRYTLYKYNHVKYDVQGYLCRGVKQEARLLTYLFGDEHLQQFSTEEVRILPEECQTMKTTKNSPSGKLEQMESGTWATKNKLDWKQPNWGLPECCHWVTYSVTNYYIIPVRVYVEHDRPGKFRCSGADVSKCPDYFENKCQTGEQALIWTADPTAKCKYLRFESMKGRQLHQTWLADNGLLALTHQDGNTEVDCGKQLNISDQGLAFMIEEQGKSRRERTVIGDDSLVTSTLLAAEQQALYQRMRMELAHAYRHNLRIACENMKRSTTNLHLAAASQPTLTVRSLLNDSTLYSKAGNGFLELWKCLLLPNNSLQFKAQEHHCTEEIPVEFEFLDNTQTGFLDPISMVISHYGTPTDCQLVDQQPIQLYNRLHIYHRKTGTLKQAGVLSAIPSLTPLVGNETEGLVAPFIFRQLNMYSWEELQPADHINALLHASGAQAEVLALLGAQFKDRRGAQQAANELSASIISKGLTTIVLILNNPFHTWVFCICVLVSGFILYRFLRRLKRTLLPKITKRWKPSRPAFWVNKRKTVDVDFNEMEARRECSAGEEPIETVLERSRGRRAQVRHIVSGDQENANAIIVIATINNVVGRFLFDSGSAISLVSSEMASRIPAQRRPISCPTAVSVTGEKIALKGEFDAQVGVGDVSVAQTFRILDNCETDGILGYDCIRRWGPIMLDPSSRRLKVGSRYIPLEHARTPPLSVSALESCTIPERSVAIVCVSSSIPIKPGTPLIFEQDLQKADQFISPRTLISSSQRMPVRVVNPANYPITVYKDQKLGVVEATSKICATAHASTNPGQTTKEMLTEFDLQTTALNFQQQDELRDLLLKYKHLFAKSDTELPGTKVMEHHIKVTDETPIKQKAYRVPASVRGKLDEKLDDLLEAGIIEPSCSPWASPLVIVKKGDGSIRPCVDLRKVNDVTVGDSFPLPRVDESIEFLSGAKYLTTMDLRSGFLQVPMEEESKQYTAFVTHKGLFQWNYLPFGLKNAPATFSRLMQFVLSGLHFQSCIIYMDDILCASKTWSEHLEHLEEIFKRLDRYDLRLKLNKCTFARENLPFLGYLVSTQGIGPDPDNVKKLANYQPPKTVTQARSFLGFVNYYRRFIPNYGMIAKPLMNLTKKENRFRWTQECQDAFDTLKSRVTNAPLLTYPRFSQPFILSTDASAHAIGAVLSQVIDGKDQPIAYFSRSLNATEGRYATVEKELYAVVSALKHWKHYLYGHQVQVYSDQKSLSWGIKQCDSPRMMKWIQKLTEYTDLKIYFRKGTENRAADFLSRMDPLPGSQLIYDVGSADSATTTVRVQEVYLIEQGTGDADYFLQEQLKDAELRLYIDALKETQATFSPDCNRFIKRAKDLYELQPETGCLVRKEGAWRQLLVVPEHMRPRILEELHDSVFGGHLGTTRTLDKIRQKYFWEGMTSDVEKWIASCEGCLTRKTPTKPVRMGMVPITAHAPWESITIDIVGPLPKSYRGNRWILVIQDRFSKWPECTALRSATAPVVARAMVETLSFAKVFR